MLFKVRKWTVISSANNYQRFSLTAAKGTTSDPFNLAHPVEVNVKVKVTFIYIAPNRDSPQRRSGMDHTVLSANNTMPASTLYAFTRWRHHWLWSQTSCSLLLIYQIIWHLANKISYLKDERLSWPGNFIWLNARGWWVYNSWGCSEQPELVVVVHAVYADLADRSPGAGLAVRCAGAVSGRSVDWMPGNGVGIARQRALRMGIESIERTWWVKQAFDSELQRWRTLWCPSAISGALLLGASSEDETLNGGGRG